MKRPLLIAIIVLGLLVGAGATLLRTSFVSFKTAKPAQDSAAAAIETTLPAKITFNEHIGPLLSENCYFCHGQDTTARKADLRVDRAEFAFLPRKNGMPAIVKGHPEQSAIIQRISSTDPNQVMPPPSSHKAPLTAQQIALVTRWVKEGAQYQEHWAFVKPERPAPPAVQQTAWPKNAIDNFILAKLEAHNLAPEPEADRRTLIRRVTLDLTGLPPTPEEISAFLADNSPDAYGKVVDRLLANPHYGEHEGRYWLDAARYAETVGLHFDEARTIWPYRDWVIKAFNDNKPFDQFVTEQVAGDLLPHSTIEQKVATGFTRCGISTSEGGSIEPELLASYAKENVETNSMVFMGLTMGCCACHDHKFDPISQKEFYEFSAFFRNTTQKAIGSRTEPSIAPFIYVVAEKDRARWDALPGEIATAQKDLPAYRATVEGKAGSQFPTYLQAVAAIASKGKVSPDHLELHLPLAEASGPGVTSEAKVSYQFTAEPKRTLDGLLGPTITLDGTNAADLGDIADFQRTDQFSYGAWIKVKGTPTGTVFGRMDRGNDDTRGWDLYLDRGKVTERLMESQSNTVGVNVSTVRNLMPDVWQFVFVTYDGSGKAAGVKIYVNGIAQDMKPTLNTLEKSAHADAPFMIGGGKGMGVTGVSLQDISLYKRALSRDEIKVLAGRGPIAAMLATPADKLSAQQKKFIVDEYLQTADPKYSALEDKLEAMKAEYEAIKKRSPATMVMDDKPTPAFAFLLKRGQYDQPGEKLFPALPKVLPPMAKDAPKNRLGLAEWLVAPENPLLSRVAINRFWQQFFGIGIVRTSEDFGIMGERPVNQPLLDWLAVEFRESKWDVKHMVKLIVTSAAYRQSDHVSPDKREKDPENRFVSRGPRFRLDAEAIRDQALAASGLLQPTIGGPSVKPYQPPGLWEVVSMSGESYRPDTGDALYRRSMYTYLKRLAPQPQLTTFDAPSREVCTVRRERTDTPLQALALENDPQYMEAARHLAANAISASPDPAKRLDYISERLLARPLDKKEEDILLGNLAQFNQRYVAKPDAAAKVVAIGASPVDNHLSAPEQAAWTMVASELLNLDETLNK